MTELSDESPNYQQDFTRYNCRSTVVLDERMHDSSLSKS